MMKYCNLYNYLKCLTCTKFLKIHKLQMRSKVCIPLLNIKKKSRHLYGFLQKLYYFSQVTIQMIRIFVLQPKNLNQATCSFGHMYFLKYRIVNLGLKQKKTSSNSWQWSGLILHLARLANLLNYTMKCWTWVILLSWEIGESILGALEYQSSTHTNSYY